MKVLKKLFKVFVYTVCIFLTILSIFPFWIMMTNGTRSTEQIQQHAVSLLPSTYMESNIDVLESKDEFDALLGFKNSMIISVFSTVLAMYFSTLTAYAIVVYQWKFRASFFAFIMAVMMIPGQVVTIGYYQMVYQVGLVNSFIPLILPSVAAPAMVFFMRQYMMGALSLEIIQSARIDGAKELYIFNRIALPIMKPAIATQAIFSFVRSWNDLFLPSILLRSDKKTMPMMVSLLRGDIYRTEFGAVYVGLTLTVLPLFIVYFLLSKYIIAGVALGSVKG